MKKGLLVVVASVILLTIPALSCAQSLLPAGMPGFFGSGFGTPSCNPCDPGKSRFLDPLAFYVGWGDTTPGEVTFSFDGQQLGALNGLTHRWDVKGIWLGLSERANFSQNSAVVLEAWLLIPTSSEAGEFYTTLGGAAAPVLIPGGANWAARPDWWFIDGRFLCAPYASNFMLFAGFRYDHFSTRFESPTGAIFAGNADATVNSYIPYVGGEYKARASGGGNMLIRILGFPWVPAGVQNNQTLVGGGRLESTANFTDRGYFFEVFGEYDWSIFAGSTMGAFVRWNALSGAGNIDTKETCIGTEC